VQRCVDAIGTPDFLGLAASSGLKDGVDDAQTACAEAYSQARVDGLAEKPFREINAALSGLAVEASFAELGTEVETDSPMIVDAVAGLQRAITSLEQDVLV
jgi:hypothetical protein